MKVISVVGLKGGSGKTSTAVPLALEAAKAGRTALLDLDPTPSAWQWAQAAELESGSLAVERLDVKELSGLVGEIRASGAVEWVVVDTPPVAQHVVMLAAEVADLVVIPVHIGSGDLAQLVQTADLLRLPRRANPALRVVAVLNHAGTMPALTRETREAVEGAGLTVAAREIPYRKVYATAKGSRPSAGWWHFGELWRELRGLL